MEASYFRMLKHSSANGLWGIWEGSWPEVLPLVRDFDGFGRTLFTLQHFGHSSQSKCPIKEESSRPCFPVPFKWCGVGGAVPAGLCTILMLPSLQRDAAAKERVCNKTWWVN